MSAHATRTAQPNLSDDFTFINEGRDKWGLGFLINGVAEPGLRSAGSLSWGGLNNTSFWIDPSREVAGVILMQFLPFADPKALALYREFERAVYKTLPPTRPADALEIIFTNAVIHRPRQATKVKVVGVRKRH